MTGSTIVRPDLRALAVLPSGSVVELRIPNTRQGVQSGYFNDLDALSRAASQWDGKAPAVYTTLNPVIPELLARAKNRLKPYVKRATKDDEILCRLWLLIDLDPVRPSGISSTDIEHEAALARAQELRSWLRDRGWPEPILADSGNGAHILYRVNLPNDQNSTALVKSCLETLSFQFSDDKVEVDRQTWKAAQLYKVYGTIAMKGDSIPERPHRRTEIIACPDTPEVVRLELLESLAANAPQLCKAVPGRSHMGGDFDLDSWIAENNLPVVRAGTWNSGRKWILNPCPWNEEHENESAYIVQFPNGAIAAGCLHNGCSGNNWHNLRDMYEPGRNFRSPAAPAEHSSRAARDDLVAPTLDHVHNAFGRWLILPDYTVIDYVLSLVVANLMKGDPVWGFVIAPSGGAKTELINSLSEVKKVYPLSSLTAQTLISGLKETKGRENSLLLRLPSETILTLKDFTTILSLHREARGQILAQLREIYDGSFRKEFGNAQTVEWEGKIGLIAGCTEAIDHHHAVYSVLGERFVQLRLAQKIDRALPRQALCNRGSEREKRDELRMIVASFIDSVDVSDCEMSAETQEHLIDIAMFVCRARSGTIRDSHRRELELAPEPEHPTRFVKALGQLASARIAIGGGEKEAQTLCSRVGLDSIHKVRRLVLGELRREGDWVNTSKIAELTDYPTTTIRRHLEDLMALRVVDVRKRGQGSADDWQLKDEMRELWERIEPSA